VNGTITGKESESNTRLYRKLIPAQNLFYTRWLFDEVADGYNDLRGIRK